MLKEIREREANCICTGVQLDHYSSESAKRDIKDLLKLIDEAREIIEALLTMAGPVNREAIAGRKAQEWMEKTK